MKALPINSCKNCSFHKESPYPTDDSFERPSYWWCTNPNVEEITDWCPLGDFNSNLTNTRKLFEDNT